MKEIIIKNKKIGKNSPIFLIAEAGINHNGDLAIAKKLVDAAVVAEVDAIKFQTFNVEKLMLKSTPKASYQEIDNNANENFYDMIKKYEFSKEQFKRIKLYCQDKGIIFLSTPFDEDSVELLEELEISAYKIASGDIDNYHLLRLICSKRKPILLSTGMANLQEVKDSIQFIKSNGIDELVVFQCTTNYPAPYEDINLNVIDKYKTEFPDILLGFSDHSVGIEASIGAAAKGIKLIEKHFTLDKEMEGPDHKASLNPRELKNWVRSIRIVEKCLGTNRKEPNKEELEILKVARKSVVTIEDIKKGETITLDNIGIKRPRGGIAPTNFDKVIGKKAIRNIPKDSFLLWEDIE